MVDCYTDIIFLTFEQRKELYHLWDAHRSKDNTIPSDLFFAKTLPLKHFVVTTPNNSGAYEMIRYHVLPESEQEVYDNNTKLVMTVESGVSDYKDEGFYFGVSIKEGCDSLLCSNIYVKNFITGDLGNVVSEKDPNYEHLYKVVNQEIATWYSIEIALLHPTVQECFRHPRIKKERIDKKERIYNNHKIYRYVKHHFIDTDELKESIYGKSSINRKALIWYVTGHWRNYKSGKSIFIQPYWKGALRATKRAEPRNREIILSKPEERC